jgi:hypothetical protein
VQIPLSVLVLTSEIRAGLWKRNGSIMPEQVINYSEPPFCKMFRDMDLLQIQFAGAWAPTMPTCLHLWHTSGLLLCHKRSRFRSTILPPLILAPLTLPSPSLPQAWRSVRGRC